MLVFIQQRDKRRLSLVQNKIFYDNLQTAHRCTAFYRIACGSKLRNILPLIYLFPGVFCRLGFSYRSRCPPLRSYGRSTPRRYRLHGMAQICRIFCSLVSRHAMPTHTSGNRLDACHAFRYWYRHDLCLSARASCSHYCQPMTARPPRPLCVRRSCLHIFIFTALRRFLWSFSNCALFWWFVVRSFGSRER